MNRRRVRKVAETSVEPGMNPRHRVRLVLEPGHWREFDPFLLLAEDWFERGTFGDHPHRGFETVTYVIEGEVQHNDNHGGHGVLRPGDAQWMTAGRGVVHSEEAGPEGTHTLQLWINLPSSLKMTEPRYQDLRGAEVPVRREAGAELRVYSGASGETVAETRNSTPITMIEMRLEPGASVVQEIPGGFNTFLYLLEGSGRFGADGRAARAGEVVWFEPEDSVSSLEVGADETLRAMLWGGAPIGEPVAARGPFVMNTQQELVEAYQDYQAGRF